MCSQLNLASCWQVKEEKHQYLITDAAHIQCWAKRGATSNWRHRCWLCHCPACEMEEPHLDHGPHFKGRRPINQQLNCFNNLTQSDVTVLDQHNIGYLPTINAPATQMSTVNKVVNHSFGRMQCLDLSKSECVFDRALYAKAAEITRKHSENQMSPKGWYIKQLITTTQLPLSNGYHTRIYDIDRD